MKNIRQETEKLTDRQIQERTLEYTVKNEGHLRFLSNVVTVYIFITLIAVGFLLTR